jgi:hypothetical protein
MPKVQARKVWQAEVELEIERLALSVQYIEKGQGSRLKRYLVPTDWLDKDGETIVWDAGKRLKGWLKSVVATMKPTWKDRVQHGIVCKSLPNSGFIPIAKLSDIAPSRNWHSFQHKDMYDLNGLPEPNVEVITTEKGGSIFSMYYVLSKPVKVKVAIYGFAQGITWQNVKEWMETLGQIRGLGDKHTSSEAYGTFKVLSFELKEEKEVAF